MSPASRKQRGGGGIFVPSSEMEDREEKQITSRSVVFSLEIQESAHVRGKLRHDDNNGTSAVMLDDRLF